MIRNRKPNVLVITNQIPHYRIPVFNELCKSVELEVIYSEGLAPNNVNFKTRYIRVFKVWKFVIHMRNLKKIINEYDVVILMECLQWISLTMLAIQKIKPKKILWGMGVRGSTNHAFDFSDNFIWLSHYLYKKTDALVFYSDYPKEKHSRLGIDVNKMFVAPNTVEVKKVIPSDYKKKNILFIGTLYKNKKLASLIEEYDKAVRQFPSIPQFVIIGEGEERAVLEGIVGRKNLMRKVKFLGNITDENDLEKQFSEALICVSLGQAGLSVQKAMGYGVPFITMFNAFTGGERFDIHHGDNGLLLRDKSEFCDVFIDLLENREKYLRMGHKAYDYYWGNRTIYHMVQGFLDAIQYVLKLD